MAETLTKSRAGLVTITGKIDRKSFAAPTHYTQVVMPAVDEYSKPQYAEIRSTHPLGGVGEIVTVDCRLGGYQRSYMTKGDQSKGTFPEKVVACDMTLDAVS